MGKYNVTKELAETVRRLRIDNRITAKSISDHIGKSQAYMSKLEKGDIKSIEDDTLLEIFRFILGSESKFQEFLNSTLSDILNSLQLRLTDNEIEEQMWLVNFDEVLRQIPVPAELANDIRQRMAKANISTEYLCTRINANEALAKPEDYPINQWVIETEDNIFQGRSIRLNVTTDDVDAILSCEKLSSNYITIQAIAYYLLKIEMFGSQASILSEDNKKLYADTVAYLNSFKFFSISERYCQQRLAESKAERDSLLSSFDRNNMDLINKVISSFRLISEIDIARANEILATFVENLEWDSGFMMRLISLDFSKLEEISYASKKQMLSELSAVIEKYYDLPRAQKSIDLYE